jgi:hypothetical protein
MIQQFLKGNEIKQLITDSAAVLTFTGNRGRSFYGGSRN